jgi:hypothetical protein
MTRFVLGDDRSQSTLFPERLDDYLGDDNPVRAIDVFVDELDLAKLGFGGVEPEATGRPAYHPATLLKIYVYGYLNRSGAPSGAANPGRAVGRAAADFSFLQIGWRRRWPRRSEIRGQLSGWRDGALYPLARGCRAPRRIMPELEATAPPIPFWFYRVSGGGRRGRAMRPSHGVSFADGGLATSW